MSNRTLTLEEAQEAVAMVEAELRTGAAPPGQPGQAAVSRAAKKADQNRICSRPSFYQRLERAKSVYELEPDWSLYRPHRYQQPVPRAVVNDAPARDIELSKPTGTAIRVLVIGDLHQDPRHPHRMEVLKWIARYASKERFTHIVQIGDWSTWDSCNFHDKNDTSNARSKPPIARDMENLKQSLAAFQNAKDPDYRPRQYIVLGNHENRVERFENANPEAYGTFTLERDQAFLQWGWHARPYGELFYLAGIAFTHHPVNGVGRAFGGETGPQRAASKTTVPIVSGHTHKRQLHDAAKIGPTDVISMVEVGCALPWGEVESYAKHGMTGWWYGVVPLTIQGGVITDVQFKSMLALEAEYGERQAA